MQYVFFIYVFIALQIMSAIDESLLKYFSAVFFAGLLIIVICWIWKSMKERKQASEKAEHYFTALKRSLGTPYPLFYLRAEDRQHLVNNGFTGETIYYHLVVPFMTHLNAPFTMFNVRVTDGTNATIAGQYSNSKNVPTIDVLIKPMYTIEQIIATVCHECMHHYLRIKKIRGRTEEANEKLTDYACIYTGFGGILYRGYGIENKNNGFMVTRTKIGYLTRKEVNIANKCLKKYR